MSNTITVGNIVRVLDHEDIGEAYRGQIGVVKATGNTGSGVFEIAFDNEATLPLGDGGLWHDDSVEVLDARPTERPTILLDHETSRDYARAADSRVLDAHHRAILTKAADGHPVDAYAFNAALTAAMSSAATRLGQSMARRALTSKIRHLAYKTQAVLENHADGLPAYAEGDRSRAVEAAKAGLREAKDTLDAVTAERDRLRADLTLVEGNLGGQINRAEAAEKLAGGTFDALQYALTFLGETEQARVKGYVDRINEES